MQKIRSPVVQGILFGAAWTAIRCWTFAPLTLETLVPILGSGILIGIIFGRLVAKAHAYRSQRAASPGQKPKP